ncbi:phenylacetate--CoA ligase family protein [Microvirga thermotolerans]|uniref:Phenylacetate--CoA ligase family protein n=1 Tax=Microvirga thermotolerans TaxID=2651334 RepID=A0A5P9JQ22_9HYPH|nr:phenylacetate--CoA ligase family protein [Microvirga thermotolerans]QFU14737.1 phenylacetate--CoA ligase family protein [Microvirga thermotolerans]
MSESILRLILDAHRARRRGGKSIVQRQQARFAEMVVFARTHSPYYRELYRRLPDRVDDPARLPVTSKSALMERFDDWVTDQSVTRDQVRAFVSNVELVGERLMGRYLVATTSGTTGTRGVFLIDDRSLAVTSAMALRMLRDWLSFRDVLRIMAGGGRTAMVMATGGHFASAVAAARLQKGRPGRAVQVLSVHTPIPELVAQLNRFRPVVVAPYASMAALLASEQEAGRLNIKPALVALSAEGLPLDEYDRIARTFGTKVGNSYAATECPFLSYGCEHGWLHVNSDWVVLEPVDADHRPVPPGEPSHTVLVSNLANKVQPILRYDLGDSVLQRPDPCPCGNPLPAIRVQGRAADVLTFPSTDGHSVTVAPLAFGALAARVSGIQAFQVVQTAPANLRVRLRYAAEADADRVWQVLHAELMRLLTANGATHVRIERAKEPPEQSPGGKFREVIPLR